MQRSPARWTTALAAAALIALPGSALAQPTTTQNPTEQNPPASSQPDQAAAKQHLTEARDTLSQLTSMPEAAKLQGDSRAKVSALISSFNALITTPTDWRAADAKVNDSLTALLGADTTQEPAAAAATATGTTGTAGTETAGTAGTSGTGSVQVDPAIRAKLVEFRTHLKAFEKSAGGAEAPASPAPAPSAAPPSSAPPASTPPPSAAPPSSTPPPSTAPPTAASSSDTPPSPSATATAGSAQQNVNAAAQAELAAIDAILAKSTTGALTKTETSELKQHIDALRALLK